jgi:putative transposase
VTEHERGSDRLGRRAKRFLTPLQKDEIWLRLVRGEASIAEAAGRYGVDRSTIMRLRMVAKDGALQALAESSPVCSRPGGMRSWGGPGGGGPAGRGAQGVDRPAVAGGGEGRWAGWPGPPRVDAATKSGLLDLLCQATQAGWTVRAACRVLEVNQLRIDAGWTVRVAGELADQAPGGRPMHGLLDWEVAEILRLFEEWGEVDRSHRKLAHRGSYLERVWISPASVRRVLDAEGLRLRPLPRPGRTVRKPFPDWVEYRAGSSWIYDTTHLTRAGVAATVVEDLVSRKWLAEVVSVEETATQVQVVVTEALERGGLWERVTARQDGLVDLAVDDPARPVLLALSLNGPQMTSGSTRAFLALCAIHQHFGRPGTRPTRPGPGSLFGHVKAEWPHLSQIQDPAVLRAEPALVRERYNGVRLHAGIGYVTPNDEHQGRGPAIRKARARPDWSRPACSGLPGIASTVSLNRPRSPTMLADRSAISIANSATGQL